MVYIVVVISAVGGFVSLGVDWGRVQLTKTELQGAADAASRAAAAQLSNGITATQNAAVTWGGYNIANGSTVVIDSTNDVDFGTWDTSARTFTVLSGASRSTANAVRVYARRTAARGTAVNLAFGIVIGRSTCDATASAIAYVKPGNGNYGLVGMSSVGLQTNTITTDSYDASAGAYSAGSAGNSGYVASNGGITLNGTVTINDDVYMLAGQTLSTTGLVNYNTRKVLSSSLVFPVPSAGSYATTNSNGSVGLPASGANASFSSGTVAVPAGTYYLNSFSMTGGTLNFSGPTTIYMNGNFSITGGTLNTYGNLPTNLTIKTVTAAGVTISGTTAFYGDVQAPSSTINISGVSDLYGRFIGSQLNVTGSARLHVDTSLPAISGASTSSTGAGNILTVR